MGIIDFYFYIVVIINIYEVYIDYYGIRKEYVKVKWNF